MADYNPDVYRSKEWFDSLGQFDEWNKKALLGAMALLGIPESFMDIGCGNGGLVHFMEELVEPTSRYASYKRSVGVEINGSDYFEDADLIIEHDLREPLGLNDLFELVICWEVGEHLPEESANILCQTLSDQVDNPGTLIFTAAHKGQGGDYHVNEQDHLYWVEKLLDHGLAIDRNETEKLHDIWTGTTGPCWWLPMNVMVFHPTS